MKDLIIQKIKDRILKEQNIICDAFISNRIDGTTVDVVSNIQNINKLNNILDKILEGTLQL